MAKKFSIKDLMNEESKSGTVTHFEILNIPIEKIKPSELNKYGIRDIEELAASIEEMGLLHNLVVKPINDSGLYELISGERRYRACELLFENGNEQYKYLPCKIEKAASDAITELKLIHANALSRVLNDAEKIYQAGRINEILYKLKEEGYEFTGRMRAIVAQILDVSDAQAGRMIKMDKDLTDKVKEEIKAGNIGITAAYEMSSLSENEQLDALKELKQTGEINVQAHKRKCTTQNVPTKEQQTVKTAFERAGINFYYDDGTVRDPAEFGREIYKFLGILE
jgi:ParB family chromosome partitioning protein